MKTALGGLRTQETTALAVDDLSFSRGEEEIRVAKGNTERVVTMSQKLRKFSMRYPKVREALLPTGEAPLPTSSSARRGAPHREHSAAQTLPSRRV